MSRHQHEAHGQAAGVEAPSRRDPLVTASSQLAGGPAGRRLASGGFWSAVPILVLLAVVMLGAGVLEKQHCRAQGWSTPDQFWHACYSDIAVLHGSAALGAPDRPTLAEAVSPSGLGQPPLASAAMWALSWFADGTGPASALRFFDLSTLVLAVVLVVTVAMLAAMLRRRRWDAAHVALSPLLVTAALVSYQLLALGLTAGAMLAASRRRVVLAGVLLGLGVATAPQLAVLAVSVVLVAGRARRAPEALGFALAAVLVWLGLRVVLLSGLGAGLRQAWAGWRDAGPGYGSLWLVPQLVQASKPAQPRWWIDIQPLGAGVTSVLSLLLLAGVLIAGAAVTLMAPRRPAVAPVALMLLVGTLLASKSIPVQASLLLLPLIAAAGLPWRDHLVWAVTELAYFVGVWLYIAAQSTPDRGLPANFYLVLLLVRVAGLTWIGIQAARAALEPADDDLLLPADPGHAAAAAPDPAPGAAAAPDGAVDRISGLTHRTATIDRSQTH